MCKIMLRRRYTGVILFAIIVLIACVVWSTGRPCRSGLTNMWRSGSSTRARASKIRQVRASVLESVCYTNRPNPSVLILIVHFDNGNPRWEYQYQQYNKFIQLNKHDNIHFKFIQCGKEVMDDEHHLYLNCTESFVPGILLKTILAMNKYRDQYDYVLRTNISTHTNFSKLMKMIQQYDTKRDIPLYTGGSKFDWGINGGTSLMNRKAANILVDDLFPQYDSVAQDKNPDDVVMGSVLKKYMQYDDAYTMYWWNYEKTADENIMAFRGRKTPFIRLRPPSDDNPTEMDPIYDKLIEYNDDTSLLTGG